MIAAVVGLNPRDDRISGADVERRFEQGPVATTQPAWQHLPGETELRGDIVECRLVMGGQ